MVACPNELHADFWLGGVGKSCLTGTRRDELFYQRRRRITDSFGSAIRAEHLDREL
jgi:hypothetical protein